METEFLPNNSHLESAEIFSRRDPHLRRMQQQKYIFKSEIIEALPIHIPGIYNLGGGRQIGKTTLLKQWMQHLLDQGITPESICFFSCEFIRDDKSLYRIVTQQLKVMPEGALRYLILDEITYVDGWGRAIKYLADSGAFDNVIVVLSGSDLVMMQDARKQFPGRRGKADKVDFHYYPLSFKEFLELKKVLTGNFNPDFWLQEKNIKQLYVEFNQFLIHGGYLTAINEYAETQKISQYTLATYSDWVRGDILKRDKKEYFLKEVLEAILKHYCSQISWRNLVKSLSIDHLQTTMDYVGLLESMDAVYVQAAIIEEKLVGAPKKQRKFMFCDPFIYHAINAWISPSQDPFLQIRNAVNDPKQCSTIVEAAVISQIRRYYPTYYIKAEGEVDVAYVKDKKFWPIELKWTNSLRPNELKQVSKYKNAQVWAKLDKQHQVQALPVYPLPWALLQFNAENA